MRQHTKLVLVDLAKYRQSEVVEALEALLVAAKAGTMEGFAYVVKVGPTDHRIGTAGTYRRHPEQALQAVLALKDHICYPAQAAHSGR